MRTAIGLRDETAPSGAVWQRIHPLHRDSRGTEFAAPRWLFWVLIAFFVLEFARPEPFVQLRLQMLALLVIPLAWLFGQNRPWATLMTAQVALVALCATGVVLATNNYSAYFQTRVMFGNVAIAVSMTWVLAEFERFRRAMWVWVAIMLYAAVWAIAHDGLGPGGFIKDENDIAQGVVTALPFALYGFEQLRGWRRWLCLALGVLFVSSVVATSSRGGFVALAVTVLFWVWYSGHRVRNAAALIVACMAFVLLSPESYKEEMSTITDTQESTAQSRLFLWTTAWNMWKDNPVLGVGAGNFSYHAGNYQPRSGDWAPHMFQRSWSGTAVHSTYLEVLSEHGLVGSTLFAIVIVGHFLILRRLRRRVREDESLPEELRRDVDLYAGALSACMVGYLAAAGFLSTLYYPYAWYLSGMAVALDVAVNREILRQPNATAAAAE